MKAAENADIVVTDTWASMGQEEEKTVRMKAFQGYQLNDKLMAAAKPGAMVQHYLAQISSKQKSRCSFEEARDEILKRRRNRCMQKAVMVTLMKQRIENFTN